MHPVFRVSGVTGAVALEGPSSRALSLELVDQEGREADVVTVTVDDRNGELAIPARGQSLSVNLGYRETGMAFMGTFVVDEVRLEGWPQQMIVVAHSIDMQGPMKQGRTQDYQQKPISTIVNEIASRSGLSAAVSGSVGSFMYTHLAQTEESDLHFVTRLAAKHGATAKVSNGKLIFVKKGEGRSASGLSMSGAVARFPDNVLEYSLVLQGRSDYAEATAGWWRGENAERVEQHGSGGGGQGQAIFKMLPMFGDGEPEAQEAAQSRADVNAQDMEILTITIIGEPGVTSQAPLQVQGVRAAVDGSWYITKATHYIDGEGYQTIIEAKKGSGGA